MPVPFNKIHWYTIFIQNLNLCNNFFPSKTIMLISRLRGCAIISEISLQDSFFCFLWRIHICLKWWIDWTQSLKKYSSRSLNLQAKFGYVHSVKMAILNLNLKHSFLLAKLAYDHPLSVGMSVPNLVTKTPPKWLDGLSWNFQKIFLRCLIVHLTKKINLYCQYAALRPSPLVHITFSIVMWSNLSKLMMN